MEKASKLADQVAGTLNKLVDTAKVRGKLAAMESRDAWAKIEAQLELVKSDVETFKSELRTDKDEAKVQAHLALMNAKQRWEALREEVETVVKSLGEDAEAQIDEAKLKAALAKLEAKEVINTDDYKQDLVRLGDKAKEEWYKVLSKVDERAADFINKFPLK